MVNIGDRYGRLTVVARAARGDFSVCKCECGNTCEVRNDHLTRGETKSCGCFRSEHSRQKATKHGGSGTRLYNVWANIIARCCKPYSTEYKRYGARGIEICDEWHDFAVFREWAMAHGYDENASHGECTIDRIDVNGNYCPENCRFVDSIVQQNNKRNSRLIEYEGKTFTLAQLARKSGLSIGTLWARLNYGWSIEKAMNTPIRTWGRES